MTAFTTEFVATPDGALECLCVNRQADPARGAFVLLHGIQGTASAWSEVAPRLGGERTVLMPNMRGRGRSPAPEDPGAYTLEHFAADLHAVIAAVPGPVTLVGWSMGVLVALTLLARHGAHGLDGLVLASGTARPAGEAVWFHAMSAADIAEEARDRATRLGLVACAAPVAVAGAWASVRMADLRPALAGIRLPTLVLHGEQDDQCPLAHGRLIAAAIPDAALEIWPDTGHNPMARDPQRFAQAVLRLYGATRPDIVSAIH
ncbi:alpha/beta fold hydrolase [Ancylobacter sp. VNQ12]|uniref:alpha/beta fold hydrolase n=1 Tax=Ancylobacter sp. VNQ12 TaxID=3400920 RepID=UPI003C1181ED